MQILLGTWYDSKTHHISSNRTFNYFIFDCFSFDVVSIILNCKQSIRNNIISDLPGIQHKNISVRSFSTKFFETDCIDEAWHIAIHALNYLDIKLLWDKIHARRKLKWSSTKTENFLTIWKKFLTNKVSKHIIL